MRLTLGDVAALVSALATLTALLSTITSYIRQGRRTAHDMAALSETQEKAALESNNIDAVSSYLFETIGSVRIGDYVRDQKVRARATRALNSLGSFLDFESRVEKPADYTPREPLSELATNELKRAREEIITGQIWNGLARLRREIEMRLKELLNEGPSRRLGAGRLLSLAQKEQKIPNEAVAPLHYAISVANQAIHGEDLDIGRAMEAVWSASRALDLLAAVNTKP